MPMTRASTISFAFFSVGLSKLTSKSWQRSKLTVAMDSMHGLAPAAATPVMVTTTVSGDGWATSMVPAPVWLWPQRDGTPWPCRSPSLMLAGGGGAGAGAAGTTSGRHGAGPCCAASPAQGISAATNPARYLDMALELLSLATRGAGLEVEADLGADHEGVGDGPGAAGPDDVLQVGLEEERPVAEPEGVVRLQDRLL